VPTQVDGKTCVDAQEPVCSSRLFSRASADSARLHTVEASLRLYLLAGISAVGALAYTYADVLQSSATTPGAVKEPMWRVPPLYGSGALQLRRPRSVVSFAEVAVRWALAQSRLATQDLLDPTICPIGQTTCMQTPGYLVVSARTSLRLSRRLYMTGIIENISNETYRPHGSGILGPGLGANISLEGNY
jgi:outer membrane receptor protein involved in Fe transport